MKSVWSSFIIGNYLIFFLIIQHPNWSFDKEKKYMHISFQSLQLDSWNCYVCDKISKTWSTPKITEMLIYSLECLHLKFYKVSVTNHALQAKLTYAIGFLNYRYVSEIMKSKLRNTFLDICKENIYCQNTNFKSSLQIQQWSDFNVPITKKNLHN